MLQITQRYAQIGIETHRGDFQMRRQLPRLEMKQEHAKIEIKSELPRVHIDQYQCFAEAGLKSSIDLAYEATQLAKQQVMAYIAETVADGDMLAAIEAGGEPIADIAERKAFPQKEFNIDTIPKSRPIIEVTGEVRTNFVEGDLDILYDKGNLDIRIEPTKLNIYIKQWHSIVFDYVGKRVDLQV